MYAVSDKFLQAVQTSHKGALRVDVCSPTGTVLTSLTTGIKGSVDIDETRQVRRTLSLTIESQGRLYDTLIPVTASDLLHPASMNELRVYRGVDYQNGTSPEMCPLGVFRLTKPKITKTAGQYEIAITGNDRSAWISRLAWQAPFEVSNGTDLATAIRMGMNFVRSGATSPDVFTYNMNDVVTIGGVPTSVTMPDTIWGADLTTGSNDPMADFITAATNGGCELFFDQQGTVVLRPVINPTTAALSPTGPTGTTYFPFVEGANCTVNEMGTLLDETVEYNGVIVISVPSGGGAAVQGAAWITDPSSPVYYEGAWGQVPYIIKTTTALTSAQCVAAASAQLQLIYRAMNTVDLSCIPNPALAEGDVFTITSPGLGLLSQNHVFSAAVIPLDWESPQTITCRSQVNPSG